MTTDAKQSLSPRNRVPAPRVNWTSGKMGRRAPTSPKAIPVSPAGQFGSAVMSLFKLANSTSRRHPRFQGKLWFSSVSGTSDTIYGAEWRNSGHFRIN
jgi:hypothetical protein